jgi:hypothetical protein
MNTGARIGGIAAMTILCGVTALAQKGGGNKPPKEPLKYAGTLDFRCDTLPATPCADPLAANDRIMGDDPGDGSPHHNYALTTNFAGAGIYGTNHEFHYNPGPVTNGFRVTIHFPAAPVEGNACNQEFNECFFLLDEVVDVTTQQEIQSHWVDEQYVDVLGGLTEMTVGEPGLSRIRFDFHHPHPENGTDIFYRVQFTPINYSGATPVQVIRTGECTWIFEADETMKAGVWAFKIPERDLGRKNPRAARIDFGLYALPFKLTLQLTQNVIGGPQCAA